MKSIGMLDELPDNHDHGHLNAILNILNDFDVCIEIGAHRGTWTKVLNNRFDTVYTFEPNPDYSADFNIALGDKEGFVYMEHGSENTGQYHISDQGRKTPISKLDNFGLDPDFIKIDVEGYELQVLEGGEATILEYGPAIMVEMNGLSENYGYNDKTLKNWFYDREYRLVGQWNKDYLFV